MHSIVVALVLASSAAMAHDASTTAKAHRSDRPTELQCEQKPPKTCDEVREFVRCFGKVRSRIIARFMGASAADIKRAEECLR
jgi:hypothetical protein